MGALYEITKREHEADELRKYLAFYNVRTRKRDQKEQRLHEMENELRVLRRLDGDMTNGNVENEQIHVQLL